MSSKLFNIAFLFLLFSYCASAQEQISGKIVDATSGEPLPGAGIMVKGTAIGAASDLEGNFMLSYLPKQGDSLLVNYAGYQTQTVFIGNNTNFVIKLVSESTSLQEVVVIGYETVNKRDVQSAVSSVKAKEIKDIPITDAAQAITGRLAGVQVTTSQGGPGAGVNIRIRGGGSLSQDNSPIYIVDGMQLDNALQTISPQDIESIDILKDAAATAIYGARGANGVVIITTKSGKNGKTVISFNSSVGFREILKKLDVLNPAAYVKYQYERQRFSSADSSNFKNLYGSTFDTLGVYNSIAPIDWQEQVFGRKAPYYNNNLSITGGNKTTNYNLSLTSNVEQGIMLSTGSDRKLFNFKIEHAATDRLKVGFNVRFLNQRIDGAGTNSAATATAGTSTSSASGTSTNRLKNAVQYQPFAGNLSPVYFDESYFSSSNLGNPVLLTQAYYQKQLTNALNMSAYGTYNLSKSLNFRSTWGYNINLADVNNFFSSITSEARKYANQPIVRLQHSAYATYNNSNVLTYKKSISYKHDVTILLGEEIFATNNNKTNEEFRNFPVSISNPNVALLNLNLGTGVAGESPVVSKAQSKLLSFFTRLSYSYKDKYLASFSLRGDGSSKFAPEHRWGVFPAGSFAWRFAKETFWNKPAILSDGKFRISYGLVGNNRIDDYLYFPYYNTTSARYFINGTINPAYASPTLVNYNLKWETTVSRNLGLDLAFLNNRIQLSVDVYSNSVKNLLLDTPIPTTSGYTTQIQNIGATSNKGLEIQLNATMVQAAHFSWTTGFNYSMNRNKVESLGPVQNNKLYASGWASNDFSDYKLEVGKPVGQMYGFMTEGFYKGSDFTAYNAATNIYTLKEGVANGSSVAGIPAPGSLKLKDLNGDGLVNDLDKTVIGNSNPKFIGGFNNQFTFRNFDLSIFINWVYGNKIYNANKLEMTSGYYANTNLLGIMENRYTTVNNAGQRVTDPGELDAINQHATLWRPITGLSAQFLHSWAVEDGSFLRVNNVTLGYTLPAAATKFIRISSLRIYATVNNLMTITNYSGYDPEVNTRTATPLTPGVDYAAYPRARVYVAGINLTF